MLTYRGQRFLVHLLQQSCAIRFCRHGGIPRVDLVFEDVLATSNRDAKESKLLKAEILNHDFSIDPTTTELHTGTQQ